MHTAEEFRAELVGFLRGFDGELQSDTAKELAELIQAEFSAATGCFVSRAAFTEALAELGQAPSHYWRHDRQTWRVRRFRLDWGFHAAPA